MVGPTIPRLAKEIAVWRFGGGTFPKPPMDVAPLLTMTALACIAATYMSIRDIRTNPDVRLTKAHRADEMAELSTGLERAQGYCQKGVWSSLFAKIGSMYDTSAKSTFVTYGRE
ncbi:hypothetical protein N2152v2_003326 [Parachlorella kessleri]